MQIPEGTSEFYLAKISLVSGVILMKGAGWSERRLGEDGRERGDGGTSHSFKLEVLNKKDVCG